MVEYKSVLGGFYGEGETEPPANPPAKTFTQDEVNAMMAEHKRGLQKQIEDLKKGGDTTALQKKIKELSDSLLSTEELAKRKADELKSAYDAELTTAKTAADQWSGRYYDLHKQQEIIKAATTHDAFDAEQLSMIIGPNTKTVEVTDDTGKGTGQFKVVTAINIDGKVHELPTIEAVGKLRETGKYPNQFKVKVQGGTGTTTLNNTPGVTINKDSVPGSMADFMKTHGHLAK